VRLNLKGRELFNRTVANKDASPVPNTPPPKAAALQYDKDKGGAPKLTAKGKGQIAEKIIALAKEHNIPLHRDADLLEILDKVEIDTEIPLEVYAIVAEIFAYIYRVNQNKAQPV
jgi:flagellar biosynthesis protein